MGNRRHPRSKVPIIGQGPELALHTIALIGGIGAASVFKTVYIDKRELKCACVGGDSNVPRGFISLTERLMMIAMAVWMLATPRGMG